MFIGSLKLYSADQVRELDRLAIEDHGIPGHVLMKRAGRAAFNALLKRWPNTIELQVFCGSGNNGGDGYIVAALAKQRGLGVTVWQVSPPFTKTAQQACEFARQEEVEIKPWDTAQQIQSNKEGNGSLTVVVDALLGTGAKGELRSPYSDAISFINQSNWPVLALDIPSGVNADTGSLAETAVHADLTVSFIGQKLGNLAGEGRLASGHREIHSLDVPSEIYTQLASTPLAQTLDLTSLLDKLPKRPLDAHKGDSGHLLVVGGDIGFGGAPLMAAQMALRAGAGLVGVATQSSNTSAVITRQPEIMAKAVESGQAFLPLLEKPTVLVVGPGLGQSGWSEQLLYHCLHANLPMVVDADALNILSQNRLSLPETDSSGSRPWVITPHPGEAARLLETTIQTIQEDRIAAVSALQNKFHCSVVLKGAGTLVMTTAGQLFVCDAGNPGMASGGMGDVLSGLIGALIAQGLTTDDAACLGVLIHAQAGDYLAQSTTPVGFLATDLIEPARYLLRGQELDQ